MSDISRSQFIQNDLIGQLRDIVSSHAYLSTTLICSGIEFLGKCVGCPSNEWFKEGRSRNYFNIGLDLFPTQYHMESVKNAFYDDLRCGMVHGSLPGGMSLRELKNTPEGQTYEEYLYQLSPTCCVTLDYFYFDFTQACQKVLRDKYLQSKLAEAFINVS